MKQRILMMVSFLMLFVLTACGNTENSSELISGTDEKSSTLQTITSTDSKTQQEGTGMASKTLVVYFSCTGTTEQLANYAAELTGADIYEIIPTEPYTQEDLAYYTNGRADQEQNNSASRPSISGRVENMNQYDTILLGYPIWHGQAPRIISTFLESYDFSGKTIVPFCTSHSSGVGSSASNLHILCPDSTQWRNGTRFSRSTSKAEIKQWLQDLSILKK